MIIVRDDPRDRYTIIPTPALEDAALSWRARGLLAYLLSRPAGWSTNSEGLALLASEGRDAVRTALAELTAAGYLRRIRTQDDRGRWRTDTVVYDTPHRPVPVDNFTDA